MEKRLVMLGLVMSIFLIVNVSAGVYFSQPDPIYNLGDVIDMQIEVVPLEEGPISIDLICEGNSQMVFYTSAPEETINFKFPLTIIPSSYLTGDCQFIAEYSNQIYESRNFQISKRLDVNLDTNSFFAKPSEKIIISGKAKRLSGVNFDGEVSINIPLLKLMTHKQEESDDSDWSKEAENMATDEWSENEYEWIYNMVEDISNIEDKEDINSVEILDEKTKSVNTEDKDAIVLQKLRVNYEPIEDEDSNETDEGVVYLEVTTEITNQEIDFQDFEEVDEDYELEIESETGTNQTAVDTGMFYGKIVNGSFSVNFVLEPDTYAGDYRIDVFVYEKDSDGVKISEGLVMANLKVSQVLTNIDILLGNPELDPGKTLSFKLMLLDQNDFLIEEKISVIVQDEFLNRIFEKIIDSGTTIEYDIPTNLTAGYYDIISSSGKITESKNFYVNEKAIISFEIINNTLIVTNIGNIHYKKDIEISFGEKAFVERINLGLMESAEFELIGYDGQYEIKVSDGLTEITKTGVALTGNAINVRAVGNSAFLALKTPIVWIFFIIVLGAGILFIFRKTLKKKSFAYPFAERLREKFRFRKHKVTKLNSNGEIIKQGSGKVSDKVEHKKKSEKESRKSSYHEAEPVLVLKGQKNRATVIALKIKNKITKPAKKSLEKAIEHVYEKRGAVYEQGDYIFIVFSPLMTRSFKNEVKAVGAAEKIVSALKEHNKRFNDKIDFGVGINSGNIVSKFENKKLKFTALGNLISPAKRLAIASNQQVLITKETYERGISDIKASKKMIGKAEVYQVKHIMDSEKNKRFIEGFLRRMGEDEKKNRE